MQRVGEFKKVTASQFLTDMDSCGIILGKNAENAYDTLELPVRGTSGSAGYDFKAPFGFTLEPGESIVIPTGLRVLIDEGWWLAILPRSGHGFKYRAQLDNTVGVIDSDYCGAENQGHIMVKITNDGREGKTLSIRKGDGFVQAIFLPYGITYSDDRQEKRRGGFGSTDRENI